MTQRLDDRIFELGRQRGFQHEHGDARLTVFERNLEAIGRVRVYGDAIGIADTAYGAHTVGMAAGAGNETVIGDLVEIAFGLEVESAPGINLLPQLAYLPGVTTNQIEHEALEIGSLADIHGWA